MFRKWFHAGLLVLLILLWFSLGSADAMGQKLAPDEIIAKHIASLGKSQIVANSRRIMAIGPSEFIIRSSQKRSDGKAVFASDGTNMAFFSTFGMSDYRMERIGIFGDKIDIPIVLQGHRSPLGSFLAAYDKLLDDRLFGGCMFSTWLFFGSESYAARLETEGK